MFLMVIGVFSQKIILGFEGVVTYWEISNQDIEWVVRNYDLRENDLTITKIGNTPAEALGECWVYLKKGGLI